MRRIALFSDIHANPIALDAVLSDIAASGIEERYCLGDLIGYGPDPAGVIERMRASGIPTIPGNYDEGVAARRGECGCYYATDEARADGAESYRVTDAMLAPGDAAWLLGLPRELWFEEAGARVLLTHGSPRKINEYLLLDRTEAQLAQLALAAGADAVCHGHIHVPYHRSFEVTVSGGPEAVTSSDPMPEVPATAGRPVRRVHYVSSGSVGKPKDGDRRACWVELVLGEETAVRASASGDRAAGPVGATDVWLGTVVHRVDYDIESVVEAMRVAGLPDRLGEALRRA